MIKKCYKLIVLILFFYICGDIYMSSQKLLQDVSKRVLLPLKSTKHDLMQIQIGTKYNDIIETFGQPDFVNTGNNISIYYIIDSNTTYNLWFGLSDSLLRFTIIYGGDFDTFYSDGDKKVVFYDNRFLNEQKNENDKVFYAHLGTLYNEILKTYGAPNETNNSEKSLIYRISENTFVKQYFTESGKLWKMCYYKDSKEWDYCFDIRIKENEN